MKTQICFHRRAVSEPEADGIFLSAFCCVYGKRGGIVPVIDIFKKIVTNVLTALYQPFGFSVLLSVLFMFLYLYAKEHGWKEAGKKWLEAVRTDAEFRRTLLLVFYTALILFRTLLNRNLWANPLSNVLGSWGLYNAKGELTTEAIENLLLFIPFAVLLPWVMGEKTAKLGRALLLAGKRVFLFSVTIEFLQLFLRLGTFQLSDLCYNTLGGLIGGFFYWLSLRLRRRGTAEQ